MTVTGRQSRWNGGLRLLAAAIFSTTVAVGGASIVQATTSPGRVQHSDVHLIIAVGLAVLIITSWRAKATASTNWIPSWSARLIVAGLCILAGGQLLEALGAYGWAEFDGYQVVNLRLALLHSIGIRLFPVGLLTVLAGALLRIATFIRR